MSDTIPSLFELFEDPDVKRLIKETNFGWPDFLDPYVTDLESTVNKMLAHVELITYAEFQKTVDYHGDLLEVSQKLGLPCSYGKLKGQLNEEIDLLRSELVDLFESLGRDYLYRRGSNDFSWDKYNDEDLLPF